jgi:hypothetical protein
MDDYSEIVATVSIGDVTIVGDVNGTIKTESVLGTTATTIGKVNITGDFSGLIDAGTTIGAVEISGNASGRIYSGQEAAGDVTSVKAGTVTGLTVLAGTAKNAGIVGDITITGSDTGLAQLVFVDAFQVGTPATGGTVGAIKAVALSNTETLTVNVGGAAVGLGAITVEAPLGTTPANTANINIVGGAAVTSIGAILVDGSFTGTLAALKTASTFNVGSVVAGSLGSAPVVGSSIGAITIGADTGAFIFTFDSIGGATTASAPGTTLGATVTGNAVPLVTPTPVTTTGGGITFILA